MDNRTLVSKSIFQNVIISRKTASNVGQLFLDGAGPVRRFISIRLPLIGRTFAFVAIMTMANYFQMFAQFKVFVPDGGQKDSAMVLTNYIYRISFTQFDMGYASAVATALFLMIFVVAMIQNRMMRADWSYE